MAPPPRRPSPRSVVFAGVAAAALAAVVAAFLLTRGDDVPKALPGAAKARTAAQFTDSVGVNIHLTYYDTSYARFGEWRARLRALGVRHVRDGLVTSDPQYVQRMAILGRQGVRASAILDDGDGAPGPRITPVAGPLAQAVTSIEGTNEPDLQGGVAWVGRLRRFLPALKTAVESQTNGVTLVGPSLTKPESRGRIADLEGNWQVDNIHPYPGGEAPTRPSDLSVVSRRKPVFATETGYHNAVGATEGQPGVPEKVSAAYIPRLLAENFASGIQRTYLYELLDEKPDPGRTNAEQHFGLLRFDLSPKPAFAAIQNLLRQVRSGPGEGKRRQAKVLPGDPSVQQLLIHRRDGSSLLMVWRRVSLWDTGKKAPVEQDPAPVRVEFAGKARDIRVGYPSRESVTTDRGDTHRTTLMVAGDLVTVSFR